MDIHVLRIFLGLCRNLHFGRTSEEFHLSASALSRMVQRLEDEVGHQLFARDNRSVKLTDQGEIFRQFAEETLAKWDAMQLELSESETELVGRLTLFASVTASQTILPSVLTKFRQEYPGIHIQLDTGYAVNAMQRLRDDCDVVVAALSLSPDDQLEKQIITSTPILTVAPLSLDISEVDFSQVPLVIPGYGQVRDNIEKWYRERNMVPKIYSEVAGNEAALSLVTLGCGLGFVPQLVLDSSPLKDQLQIVEQGPDLEDFHVGFCTRKKSLQMSPIIRAFWQTIQSA